MNEKECNELEQFYGECAEIFGLEIETNKIRPFTPYIDHTGGLRVSRRNRWNHRKRGNGRFPGFGIVRVFGGKISVSLNNPISVHKIFNSKNEALEYLRKIMK